MKTDYSTLDAALEFLAPYGPDLANGMTSHAPMVVEAMARLDRADAALPWLEKARPELTARPRPIARIERSAWRSALGREDRFSDWSELFAAELTDSPWRHVLATWTERLAPGICASATHGILRVGHAARSLEQAETPARLRELADAFALWASTYQTLPVATQRRVGTLRAQDAIAAVSVVPPAERRFTGTIVGSLAALDDFAPFAGAVDLLDLAPSPDRLLSDLTDAFARVFLANARDGLSTIVFVHGVTSIATLRSVVPHLEPDVAREVIRFAWQSSASLYAAFGNAPALAGAAAPPSDPIDAIVDRAIASGDDHAIKLAEACTSEGEIAASAVFSAAAQLAVRQLSPRSA